MHDNCNVYNDTHEILTKQSHKSTDFFLITWLADCCWHQVVLIVQLLGATTLTKIPQQKWAIGDI